MATSASIYKLLVLPIVFLLSSLCSARATLQPACASMGACYHLKHPRSSNAGLIMQPHQDLLEAKLLNPEIRPALSKHSPRTTNELSPRLALLHERIPLSDSIHAGYRTIWRYAEAIVNSAEAYNRHHRIYEKLLQEIEQPASSASNLFEAVGTVGRLVITYGSLRLMLEHLPGDHNALDNALDIIQDFAVEMLSLCTVAMTYGVYQLAIVAAKTVIWISLTIMESGPVPELIGR